MQKYSGNVVSEGPRWKCCLTIRYCGIISHGQAGVAWLAGQFQYSKIMADLDAQKLLKSALLLGSTLDAARKYCMISKVSSEPMGQHSFTTFSLIDYVDVPEYAT
jgi:hypothetical protein